MQNGTNPCPSCKGNGVLRDGRGNPAVCPNCGGTGQKNPPAMRVPFDYAFPTVVLTANQQGLNAVLRFDFDADFEHIWTVANSTGIYSLTLQDTSTGRRQFSNAAINGENYAGTAALPFPLVEPYTWARSGAALAVFNDRSGAGNTIQLVFRGYKLYPSNAPMQGSQGLIVGQS